MNVKKLLERSSAFYANLEAVRDGKRIVTFSQAWERGICLANGLLSMGLKPQDRVGVLEDNCLESIDAYIGLVVDNLIRVPLYAGSDSGIHHHMLDHTNCRALIVSPDRLKEVSGIKEKLKKLEFIIVRDEKYEAWLYKQSREDPEININPDNFFIIRHSGGSTDLPKGIGITHRSWINNMRDWFFPLPSIISGDSFLHVCPMSHASGYMFLPVWAAGGCNILLQSFDPEECLEIIRKHKVNYVFIAPSDLNKLINYCLSQKNNNYPYLKALMSGGAYIPGKVIQGIKDVFGDVFYQSYGQTEVGIVAIGNPSQWQMKSIKESNPIMACGKLLHFVDIKIADDGKLQDVGQPGEIVVQTDGMMKNYWGKEKENNDGWIYTGDMGKLDKNGFLYILGRKEDVIIYDGCKIFPLDLENYISELSDVIEVAVIGVPDNKSCREIIVQCVVNKNSQIKNEDISAICNHRININNIHINIKITNKNLPRNSIGKVIRKKLQEEYINGIK